MPADHAARLRQALALEADQAQCRCQAPQCIAQALGRAWPRFAVWAVTLQAVQQFGQRAVEAARNLRQEGGDSRADRQANDGEFF